MAAPVGNDFAAQGVQYSKDTSYYLAAGTSSGLGATTGVTSLNGAIGQVLIGGANGVSVSVGPSPIVSLGDITPLSVNTPGTVSAGGFTAPSATIAGNVATATLNTGVITATGIVTTSALNCVSATATGALSAGSMAISGALSAGSFTLPGSLGVGSITPGSLGATTPYPMVWGSGNQATLVIAGWRLSWGQSTPADGDGNIVVTFTPAFSGIPAVTILPVRAGGGDPFFANGVSTPSATSFNVACVNSTSGLATGATVSWIAFGSA